MSAYAGRDITIYFINLQKAYDACFFEFLYLTSIIRNLINKYIKYEKGQRNKFKTKDIKIPYTLIAQLRFLPRVVNSRFCFVYHGL